MMNVLWWMCFDECVVMNVYGEFCILNVLWWMCYDECVAMNVLYDECVLMNVYGELFMLNVECRWWMCYDECIMVNVYGDESVMVNVYGECVMMNVVGWICYDQCVWWMWHGECVLMNVLWWMWYRWIVGSFWIGNDWVECEEGSIGVAGETCNSCSWLCQGIYSTHLSCFACSRCRLCVWGLGFVFMLFAANFEAEVWVVPKSDERKEILEDILHLSQHSCCTVSLSPHISCKKCRRFSKDSFFKRVGNFSRILKIEGWDWESC